MIYEIKANLLEYPVQGIIHQCNCQCCFGGGIALQIKNKYPEAYESDCKTKRGDLTKLGTFSVVHCLKEDKYIYNMYSQGYYGRSGRFTSYDAMVNGLNKVIEDAKEKYLATLGIPARIGSDLGGGSWKIVKSIIEDAFKKSNIDLYICEYKP